MAQHNNTGRYGEALAAKYFGDKGFSILHRNWRYVHWEIDIIASCHDILHFIEVKTKTTLKYGFPEEKVSVKKLRHLLDAAEQFQYLHPQWKRVQFDILSIYHAKGKEPEFFLIEDVYL